ncbi:MAG: AAA family ATPase [Actinobacteria bacterium]|nr:AAA family ATPase [Actinomycetota bacterium]
MTSVERALVGGVILSPAATDTLPEEVALAAFTDARLSQIYHAAITVYRRSPETAGDVAAVVAELTARGDLDSAGGVSAVLDLVAEGCVAAAVSWHARRVMDAYRLRTLGTAAARIQSAVTAMPSPTDTEATDDIVRFAWEQLEAATASASTRSVMGMDEVFDRWQNRSEATGIPIGLTLFNQVTGLSGAHTGHLILIAARPATGKSTVLAQAAVAAAMSGVGVLYVTLEMVAEEVLERCMANAMATTIRSLRENGVASLPTALSRIRVIDTTTATTDIAAVIRQSRRTANPISLVLVDYLQQLSPPARTNENRQTEVAAISRALKRLAVDERVAVLAASQLNRASETRADKRPSLADLRESGQLEADADVVVLMHRDPAEPFEIEFIIAKHRHGATGGFAAEPDVSRSVILETAGSQSVAV